MYRLFGLAHSNLMWSKAKAGERLCSQKGQGTVEYVALILVVSLVMFGVVKAMDGFKTDSGKSLGEAIVKKIKDGVNKVTFSD